MLLDFLTLEENLHLFSRVTRKVLSNSKHTLLCLYGHHVLARVNLIPLKHCGGSPSGWRRKASKERLIFFMLKDENEKNPEE